jgi:predicted acetyltransferase
VVNSTNSLATGAGPFTFRPAEEGDLDRLVEIHTGAFPDPRGHAERLRNFTANPLGALRDLRVAVAGDTLIAHAFLFPLDAWFGGRAVPVAGVASVGVAPEARGRGAAAALLAHLHEEARGRGAAVSMLYAFRQGFYARHGYVPVTPTRRLRVHPASIPAGWRGEPGVTIRPAARGPADRPSIEAAYGRMAARTSGWLVRPRAFWDALFADERRTWMLATRGAHVAGYVAWSVSQPESHAATRMTIHELAADDDAARRALLGAAGALRDQVAEVLLETDAKDPIDRALVDADRSRFGDAAVEHALGDIVGGPMVKVLDVARALAARGIDAGFAVDDGARITLAGVAFDHAAVGAVLFGGLEVADAVRLGWARAADAADVAKAQALFAHPPFFALDPF